MRARYLLAVLVIASFIALGAGPAGAHAELVSSSPASGARLEEAPALVELRFSEPVEASLGGLRIFDEAGDLALSQRPMTGADATVLRFKVPRLGVGGFVAVWRVVSADSHPIRGTFTFRVGESEADTSGLARRLLARGDDPVVGAALGLCRFLAYVALAFAIGVATFLWSFWPGGWARTGVRRAVFAGLVVAGLASIAAVVFQGAQGAGGTVADAFDSRLWNETASTRFGRAGLLRAALSVALGLVAAALLGRSDRGDRRPNQAGIVALLALVLATASTFALAGHAGSDGALAVAVDTVHLIAVWWWLGGLIAVVLLARAVGGGEEPGTAAVDRYSRFAPLAVGVIVATGLLQSWRQVGGWDALRQTDYGKTLSVKLLIFAAMVAIAGISRQRLLQASKADRDPVAEARRLRRAVTVEAGAGVAILAVSALLVTAVPARQALALPATVTVTTDQVLIDITVDPARAGVLDLHAYTLTLEGAVKEVKAVTMTLSQPSRDIAELRVPLRRAGPGHFAAYGFDVPVPGRWQAKVTALSSETRAHTGTATFVLR